MAKKEYINNVDFEKTIKQYLKNKRRHEDKLMQMFDILISNILTTFDFKVDREDAKQECFLLILKTLRNFDPENGRAFNYFTTIIINNLKLIYSKNKKYLAKIQRYIETHKDVIQDQDSSSLL